MAAGAPTRPRPYGGLSPDDRRADRRRRLLDAALELFARDGYASTSIATLCREAGVAHSHFYEEFDGREAVLVALTVELTAKTLADVKAATEAAGDDPAARLRAGVSAFCHGLLDDPRRARIQMIETMGVSPEVEQRRWHVLADYAGYLFGQIEELAGPEERSQRREAELRIATSAALGAVSGAVLGWLMDPEPPAIDHLAETLARLLHHSTSGWLPEGPA